MRRIFVGKGSRVHVLLPPQTIKYRKNQIDFVTAAASHRPTTVRPFKQSNDVQAPPTKSNGVLASRAIRESPLRRVVAG